jgi:hypothetical protein
MYRNDEVSMTRVFAIRKYEGQHNYENQYEIMKQSYDLNKKRML